MTMMIRAIVAFALGATPVHDWQRPDLNKWYGSLSRPGIISCRSLQDCHETEAEMRGNEWWAKVGVQNDKGEWKLTDWKKVPEIAVLQRHDNPTGNAVVCHDAAWDDRNGEHKLNVPAITIFCFIPPTES